MLNIIEMFGTGFQEYQLPEHKNLKPHCLLNIHNQISKDYYKHKILYLAWSNKVFSKAYGKEYFVDIGYYVSKGIIQGNIKYVGQDSSERPLTNPQP